jgi:hypothetical protein
MIVPEFRMRCSSLGQLMTDPISIDPAMLDEEMAAIAKKKVKTDEDKARLAPLFDSSLSAGAKTYLKNWAREFLLNFHEVVTSKYLEKGTIVEPESIKLYNSLFVTNYQKNTERRKNDWIAGECDIFTGTKIIDIKSPWSRATFPLTAADGADRDYEWQMRGYMWLWDVEAAEVAYCFVDTPEELIRFEQPELHQVEAYNSKVDEHLRVTRVHYVRERALEEKIKRKVIAARQYLAAYLERVNQEHPLPL